MTHDVSSTLREKIVRDGSMWAVRMTHTPSGTEAEAVSTSYSIARDTAIEKLKVKIASLYATT